jgi:hypothetical protein
MLSSMEEKLVDALVAGFAAHGIHCERDGPRACAQDGLRIEPRLVQHGSVNGTVQVQLDFAIDTPRMAGVPFLDSVAGVGDSQELAVQNAFEKFVRGSFHVIMEALTEHRCESEHVEREVWESAGWSWDAFIGPLFLQATQPGARLGGFEQFYAAISQQFLTLAAGPHWMRVFLGALDGQVMGREVLVDGAHWPEGEALLDAHPFEHPHGYSSFRFLVIALPRSAA